mgnify:CR=1 FL=1
MNMQATLQAAIQSAASTTIENPAKQNDVDASTTLDPIGKQNDVDDSSCTAPSIKTMTEKAMLCSLRLKTFAPYKRDEEATNAYGAGSVNKHLFANRENRVKKLNAMYREMQTYLRNNTVPWSWGKGIYMLNSAQYITITREMRQMAAKIEEALDDLVANWPTIVQTDYARLYAIDPRLANYDDYPNDIRSRYGYELDFSSVPKPEHMDPRGVPEEELEELRASTKRMLQEAGKAASTHLIQQLMKPMQEAVAHLTKPVEDVQRFSKSLITNMVDAADRMNRANLSDDPAIQKQINDLMRVASGINTETVKHDVHTRTTAKAEIEALMGQMKGLV